MHMEERMKDQQVLLLHKNEKRFELITRTRKGGRVEENLDHLGY